SAAGTLVMELAIVWMLFLPRRARIICFFIVTPWEVGVIVTANYTFLNYLVLALGFLLLDDKFLQSVLPARLRHFLPGGGADARPHNDEALTSPGARFTHTRFPRSLRGHFSAFRLACTAVMLSWIFYDTTAEMIAIPFRDSPLPTLPIEMLEHLRIANQYGLFAVMTNGRYEIEFQGSNDAEHWTPYPFRYKPQALNEAPRIYAPYQPRFDWNLWFASLGSWRQYQFVVNTEE